MPRRRPGPDVASHVEAWVIGSRSRRDDEFTSANAQVLAQQLVNGLSLGALYALFALGFTLIFGVLGVINLSHGAIFMVGAP